MAQKENQKHIVRWYSDGQLVRMSRVSNGARVRQYYPVASDRSFYCWEAEENPGHAFDFRTPIHKDLCLIAVYGQASVAGEGRYAVGVGQGSLFASRWQEIDALRMKKTGEDTYEIVLMLYRGDVLQFKREGTWQGQVGIAGLLPKGERESFCFFGRAVHGDIVVQQSGEYAFVWHDAKQGTVSVKRLADAPACTAYPHWCIVGDMNAWCADDAQSLQVKGKSYTAVVEIEDRHTDPRDGLCRFMLHNPATGQYCGALDGGHLTLAAGTYRITAELPLGSVQIDPIRAEQEDENVI